MFTRRMLRVEEASACRADEAAGVVPRSAGVVLEGERAPDGAMVVARRKPRGETEEAQGGDKDSGRVLHTMG